MFVRKGGKYAADLFPMLSDTELKDLADDIKAHGLQAPIVVQGDTLLDGRNRLKACEIAGVKPRFEEYKGDSPVSFIVSANLKRRHLTQSQLAMVGVGIKPHFDEEAKKRQEATQIKDGKPPVKETFPSPSLGKRKPEVQSHDQVGALLGVSGKLISDAEKVKKESPELAEKVKAGEITVNAAKKEIRENDPIPRNPIIPKYKEESTPLWNLKHWWKMAGKRDRNQFIEWIKE